MPSGLVMSSQAEHQGIIPEKYLISWTSLKLNTVLLKTLLRDYKDKPQTEKIFENQISDKGLLSKTCIEILKLNNKTHFIIAKTI